MSYFFPLNCRVTPEILASAKTAANQIPLLNNSIRKGAGTLVGCIGEQGFMQLFPGSVSYNTYQHDIIWNGLKIEVKTKDRTVYPKLNYNASVACFNTTQQADVYAFMSVFRDKGTDRYMRVHFCGFITPQEFYEKATLVEEGDYDLSNDWTAPTTSRALHYSELVR